MSHSWLSTTLLTSCSPTSCSNTSPTQPSKHVKLLLHVSPDACRSRGYNSFCRALEWHWQWHWALTPSRPQISANVQHHGLPSNINTHARYKHVHKHKNTGPAAVKVASSMLAQVPTGCPTPRGSRLTATMTPKVSWNWLELPSVCLP